jgi:hypothetical protein
MVKKSDTASSKKVSKNASQKKTKADTSDKKKVSKKASKTSPAKKSKVVKVKKVKSEKTVYLNYIAYHIKNMDLSTRKKDWKKLLTKNLKSVTSPDEKTLKDLALSMYLSSFAGMATCSNSFEILTKLKTSSKIKSFLEDAEAIKRKYDIPELGVVYYTKPKDILEHMTNNFQGQTSIIKELIK